MLALRGTFPIGNIEIRSRGPDVYESVAAGGREERGLKEGDEDEDEDDGRVGHRPRGG